MTIYVTESDIAESTTDLENNPISRALQRVTHQTWRVYPGGVVFQVQSPYRTMFLPIIACRDWMEYQQHGTMRPLQFDLEFDLKTDLNAPCENRA